MCNHFEMAKIVIQTWFLNTKIRVATYSERLSLRTLQKNVRTFRVSRTANLEPADDFATLVLM